MLKIGFIGAGITGSALAIKLSQRGYKIAAVYSRSRSSAERLSKFVNGCRVCAKAQEVADAAELVFITTPDDAIYQTCNKVDWHKGQGVVHCSGAHSLELLEHARKLEAMTGSFHPLQTFATISQAVENLPGSTVVLEAEEPLLSELKKMSSFIDCRWMVLNSEDKLFYHITAVFASNYIVTLVKLAADIWPSEDALTALLPLIRGTIENIEEVGLPDCLTGPIARGDLGTILKHIGALKTRMPEFASVYSILGFNTIPIALEKGGVDEAKARELEKILRGEIYDKDAEE